jgi:hypothetical protein
MRKVVFAFLLFTLLVPASAFAQAGQFQPPGPMKVPFKYQPVDMRGLFFEPFAMGSLFVTDKGVLKRGDTGLSEDLDVHTGSDYNFILSPGLGIGWAQGRLIGQMRIGYYQQFAFLNLQDDQTAEGQIRSLDFELEMYGRAFQWEQATLEFGLGVGLSTLTAAQFDYKDPSGETNLGGSYDETLYYDSPGFLLHLGSGGDITGTRNLRLGWLLRFCYRHYEFEGEGTVDGFTADERLRLNVFTALAGIRLRWFLVGPNLRGESGTQ